MRVARLYWCTLRHQKTRSWRVTHCWSSTRHNMLLPCGAAHPSCPVLACNSPGMAHNRQSCRAIACACGMHVNYSWCPAQGVNSPWPARLAMKRLAQCCAACRNVALVCMSPINKCTSSFIAVPHCQLSHQLFQTCHRAQCDDKASAGCTSEATSPHGYQYWKAAF